MKKNLAVMALLLTTMSVSAQDKIVGGDQVTDRSEAPYIVSLSGVCGGSIINSKWILTAAHCVGYFKAAKGGILNLNESGTTFQIKQVIRNPSFNPRSMTNDFALVQLTDEIDFAKTKTKPIKLADPKFASDGNENPGIDSTVYGWGDTSENGDNNSKNLNKVVVPIVSNDEANTADAYKGEIDKTMIPAGYAAGGKDSCQGDSGGPLVVFDHQNEPVQIGIVSWGAGCARAHKYGIYSRVSYGYKWIQETIAKNK